MATNARLRFPDTRRIRVGALLLACALLSSCSAPRLAPEVPPGVNLAGSWRLNRAASDDPAALIQALDLRTQEKRRPPAGEVSFGPLGGAVSRRYGGALGASLGAEGLVIEQSPGRVTLTRDGSRRSYVPGGRSVVSVVEGVADQFSGWKGKEYVIDIRPQVGPQVTQRYGLAADGRLVEHVLVSERGLPKLEFKRVYDAGDAPVRAPPISN